MKNFHPFFAIGTIGMVVVSVLHIFLALVLSLTSVHTAFGVLYPVFFAFLIMGVAFTIQVKKDSEI